MIAESDGGLAPALPWDDDDLRVLQVAGEVADAIIRERRSPREGAVGVERHSAEDAELVVGVDEEAQERAFVVGPQEVAEVAEVHARLLHQRVGLEARGQRPADGGAVGGDDVADARRDGEETLEAEGGGADAKPVVPAVGGGVERLVLPERVVAAAGEEETEVGEEGGAFEEAGICVLAERVIIEGANADEGGVGREKGVGLSEEGEEVGGELEVVFEEEDMAVVPALEELS